MERGLKNYIEAIQSDVAALVYSDGEGASFEDKFTEHCIEILDNIGKSEGARVLSYINPDSLGRIDWKINGYCLKDEFKDDTNKVHFETLDLFITHFNKTSYDYNIQKDEFTKSINQIKKFLNAALKGHIDYIDPAQTELNQLLKIILKQKSTFDRINIFFLINGNSNHDLEKIIIKGFENLDVFVHVWDIPRFYKLSESSSNREPIEIEFKELSASNQHGIQCLKMPNINELYECYLAILPGEILSKLYKEFSNELLESNVRAFLGQTGKFNKGIRDTIREKPQMFLPYNNGITATAENVETQLIDNQLYLTKLLDFQIVNGGQTTASLFHTQKKFKDADLSKVFVQMKLTVIKDVNQKNVEVPNIARFANSQNKVSELDLSSNNPYFVQIEALSRKKYVIDPENRNMSTLWYFERVNGQYKESLNKLTTSVQQRKFKEQSPTNQKFVKSDVAKYINIWELEPHFVSQGAQKNFIHYTKKINELVKKNKLPGENFYKKLIANAILFKAVDKLFGRKNIDAIGDTNLKSFTVAYTLSYFHHLTENKVDLWKIYEEQRVDSNVLIELQKLIVFVYDQLVKSSNNTLISEYAKRESSWKLLKEQTYQLTFENCLNCFIDKEQQVLREIETVEIENKSENNLIITNKILGFGNRFWDGASKWVLLIDEIKDLSIDCWEIANKIKRSKNLNSRDISIASKILSYIEEHNSNIESIKSQSNELEIEIINVKIIFDRLNLISKNDWSKILALGEQTKVFDNLELLNIKSVQKSILKNETIKEINLIKAFESLKKLKKYKIDF
ncbi:AIPR family protein [Flavobacterium sp. F-328]|uniref:AIPR family protein n=1 Tax=Flavobacterium erciyesense TaxID=2825842 RepID=A0ABS5D0Y9_9FLAO|nr:AIPR family protein [Flavobacterium erciyesense]MBQ0907680.1 AIPR family protein [Flavobacterium erciyesense]